MAEAILIKGSGGAGSGSDECTAARSQVLAGYTAVTSDSNDEALAGTMANQGAVSQALNCGGSYTVPAGYHNGVGKVTANSLASQTAADAAAANIITGKTAWVNGVKLTGTLAVQSALSFSAAALSFDTIRISWKNPAKGPWQGVMIQISTTGYPGTGGGTRAYTGAGVNGSVAGGSNYVDITGLSPGTTYYFTCTSYVTNLGYGASSNVSATTIRSVVGILTGICTRKIIGYAKENSYMVTSPFTLYEDNEIAIGSSYTVDSGPNCYLGGYYGFDLIYYSHADYSPPAIADADIAALKLYKCKCVNSSGSLVQDLGQLVYVRNHYWAGEIIKYYALFFGFENATEDLYRYGWYSHGYRFIFYM